MNSFEAAAVLGLDPVRDGDGDGYSPREIEKVYRRRALKVHPDKNGSPDSFQRLQTARDVLLRRHAGEATSSSAEAFAAAANPTDLCRIVAKPPRRTCIRQVLVRRRDDGEGRRAADAATTIVAATDDGLILQDQSDDSCRTFLEDHLFLCCAVKNSSSNIDRDGIGGDGGGVFIAYAGTNRGNLAELDLAVAAATTHREPSLWQHCEDGIVAMEAVGHHPSADVAICTGESVQLLKIVAGQRQRQATGDGRKRSVILWQSPKDLAVSPEVIGADRDPAAPPGSLRLWIGGSDAKDRRTGRLAVWMVGMRDLQERNGDGDDEDKFPWDNEFFWDDDSARSVDANDAVTGGSDDGTMVSSAVDIAVEEGPLFAMARQDRRLAAAAGKSVVVWDCVYRQSGEGAPAALSCRHRKTLRADKDLYTVTMNPDLLAAAGSGECILVWDMNSWSLTHNLTLRTVPKGCCLSTNCIMSLDWGDGVGRTLACGGYDGCISLWTLAHRLTS